MIDDPDKTGRLLNALEACLPVGTRLSELAIQAIKQSTGRLIPTKCNVVRVFYAGDEGGITCALDFGPDIENQHLVSITHLIFERKVPLYSQIDAYQRHRIKKLKKQAHHNDQSERTQLGLTWP